MKKSVKWGLFLFGWFCVSAATPLIYVQTLFHVENACQIAILKLEEEKTIQERNNLIFRYAVLKEKFTTGDEHNQAVFELQLAYTAQHQSLIAVTRATTEVNQAKRLLSLLTFGLD